MEATKIPASRKALALQRNDKEWYNGGMPAPFFIAFYSDQPTKATAMAKLMVLDKDSV
jgi:hypothetical protein